MSNKISLVRGPKHDDERELLNVYIAGEVQQSSRKKYFYDKKCYEIKTTSAIYLCQVYEAIKNDTKGFLPRPTIWRWALMR